MFNSIKEWCDIKKTIPKMYLNNKKLHKTGLSGTLVASLELVREGELLIKQKNIYDKIFIKKKNNTCIESEKKLIEAILFASKEPVDIKNLKTKVKRGTDVLKILYNLQDEYKNRGINLVCLAEKWSFRTSSDLSDKLRKEIYVEKNCQRQQSKLWQ